MASPRINRRSFVKKSAGYIAGTALAGTIAGNRSGHGGPLKKDLRLKITNPDSPVIDPEFVVPKLGYFTALDHFIIGSTLLVFLALIQSLTTSYLVSIDQVKWATLGDRICRFVFPLVFAALVTALFYRQSEI